MRSSAPGGTTGGTTGLTTGSVANPGTTGGPLPTTTGGGTSTTGSPGSGPPLQLFGLAAIAEEFGTYFLELKLLNPEIRREYLPKGTHQIKVPKQTCTARCSQQDEDAT